VIWIDSSGEVLSDVAAVYGTWLLPYTKTCPAMVQRWNAEEGLYVEEVHADHADDGAVLHDDDCAVLESPLRL